MSLFGDVPWFEHGLVPHFPRVESSLTSYEIVGACMGLSDYFLVRLFFVGAFLTFFDLERSLVFVPTAVASHQTSSNIYFVFVRVWLFHIHN